MAEAVGVPLGGEGLVRTAATLQLVPTERWFSYHKAAAVRRRGAAWRARPRRHGRRRVKHSIGPVSFRSEKFCVDDVALL